MHILNFYQNNISSSKIKFKTFEEGEVPWFFDIELDTFDEKEKLKWNFPLARKEQKQKRLQS